MARFKLLFNALWQDYSQRLCPSAVKIHHLLENDHIALRTFNHLASLNEVLRQSGFSINALGGEVKGSPSVYLEQSSTMADKVSVTFSDKVMMLPGGFYEFAKRYPMADGRLFQGFVEASADKIFESTRK